MCFLLLSVGLSKKTKESRIPELFVANILKSKATSKNQLFNSCLSALCIVV